MSDLITIFAKKQNAMAKNGKCLWIVETLLQAGALSLRELNERWERSVLYDNHRILGRTFTRYKDHIANEYAIDIDYSPSANKYYIVNREEIRDNALYRYLLSAYHIADLNTQTLRHRDRMMMEPVPTGAEHLATILEAIDRKRTVLFNYTSYYSPELQDWELVPAFLRVFEGRWYLIAEYMNRQQVKTFSLERISRLRIGETPAVSSPELVPGEYYAGCYGIIREEEKRPKLIRLWADKQQRCYLRAQPLHESQEEIETTEDHSIFTYFLRPSFDFYQRILWMREKVELLGPDEVRREMAELVRRLAAKYLSE